MKKLVYSLFILAMITNNLCWAEDKKISSFIIPALVIYAGTANAIKTYESLESLKNSLNNIDQGVKLAVETYNSMNFNSLKNYFNNNYSQSTFSSLSQQLKLSSQTVYLLSYPRTDLSSLSQMSSLLNYPQTNSNSQGPQIYQDHSQKLNQKDSQP